MKKTRLKAHMKMVIKIKFIFCLIGCSFHYLHYTFVTLFYFDYFIYFLKLYLLRNKYYIFFIYFFVFTDDHQLLTETEVQEMMFNEGVKIKS